jgi:hydroxypyruvate isomerase
MSEFSVCLETVFTDLSYEKRVARIAALGFRHVEFWHPEGTWDGRGINEAQPKDAAVLHEACRDAGVAVVGFVLNAWDGLYGGCPVRAEDHGRFMEQVHKMIEFAKKIGCSSAIVMPGLLQEGLSREQMRENLLRAFADALSVARKNDFTLLLEPLNIHVDHAGFYLDSVYEAAAIIREFDDPHLKLLYDIYHMQIMSGNVVDTIGKHIDIIGHMHVAGVPGRAEPDRCELNYPYIFEQAAAAGYKGLFGLEYFPQLDSEESLRAQLSMLS